MIPTTGSSTNTNSSSNSTKKSNGIVNSMNNTIQQQQQQNDDDDDITPITKLMMNTTTTTTTTTNGTTNLSSNGCNITNTTNTTTTTTTIPFLCQYWCYLRNVLVSKYILPYPITIYNNIDIRFTIISAIVLGCIRYGMEYIILVYIFHWPNNMYITKNAAASAAAIFHSIQLVPSLFICFISTYHIPNIQYNPSHHMKQMLTINNNNNNDNSSSSSSTTDTTNPNTTKPLQQQQQYQWYNDTVDALLQFCTGYMIYDSVLNILYMKSQMIVSTTTGSSSTISSEDILFLGHHCATIIYMTSTRILQQGHQSAMICMLLGEITNPLHNLYYIAIAAQTLSCCNGILSQLLYHYIELLFALAYVIVRTIIAPICLLHVTYNLWTKGRIQHNSNNNTKTTTTTTTTHTTRIPIILLILWTLLIWGVVLGSIPWIVECIAMIEKYYTNPSLLYISNLYNHNTASSNIHDTMKAEL